MVLLVREGGSLQPVRGVRGFRLLKIIVVTSDPSVPGSTDRHSARDVNTKLRMGDPDDDFRRDRYG